MKKKTKKNLATQSKQKNRKLKKNRKKNIKNDETIKKMQTIATDTNKQINGPSGMEKPK